ncbi:DMT family transporter [Bordetella genomosp. 9]|uniref:EamA family transporter n=1 Tax=Bordetella genomosp. 9 TaxID=1416803 RepID=A0A1W6Z078_9BORD|nr:DMT family transporter [Bordetella genomosp. 9]ARP86765.1 EamA family transporter [Bordetella genomosp. 9]
MDKTAAVTSRSSRTDFIELAILALPPLFWAGNFVVGRAARGEIPPMALSFGRWAIAFLLLLPFSWGPMRRDLRRYWEHRWLLLRVSLVGVAAFNTLVYQGLHTTTAANGLLLNSVVPVLIVLFGAVFYGHRLRLLQGVGLAVSCVGVLTIIVHGEWARLMALQFSGGDLIVFTAMACWALYTLWIRGFPADINRLGLMGAQIFIAVCALLPLCAWEAASGLRPTWSTGSLLALLYVGVVPSVLAYLLYMQGVARAGAARAGLFIHLVPVYGAVLSVLFLGESLHAYHAVGIALILVGLACSRERR